MTTLTTLKYVLAAAVTTLLASWTTVTSAAGPGCPVWMCGTNHNETLVRDTR